MLKVRVNVTEIMPENQTQAKKFVGPGALVFGLENMVTLNYRIRQTRGK